MQWKPLGVNAQSLTYELAADPRYQVRPEWVHGRDSVNRRQYRAFFNGCVIGEILPNSSREVVITELEAYVADAPVMQNIPEVPSDE